VLKAKGDRQAHIRLQEEGEPNLKPRKRELVAFKEPPKFILP